MKVILALVLIIVGALIVIVGGSIGIAAYRESQATALADPMVPVILIVASLITGGLLVGVGVLLRLKVKSPDAAVDQVEAFELESKVSRQHWTVAVALMAANLIVYLVMNVRAGLAWSTPSPEQMLAFGGNFGPLTAQGEPWRLFTSVFLHYGPMHFLLNMFGLWSVGRYADYYLGKQNTVLLFITTGLLGSLASLLWNSGTVSAGASGAIFGLYGALLGVYLSPNEVPQKKIPKWAIYGTIYFIYKSASYGMTNSGVDNAAHIGGLMSGLLITIVLLRLRIGARVARLAIASAAIVTLVVCQFMVFPRMEKLGPAAMAKFEARTKLGHVAETMTKFQNFYDEFQSYLKRAQQGAEGEQQLAIWIEVTGIPGLQNLQKELAGMDLKDQDLQEMRSTHLMFYQATEAFFVSMVRPSEDQKRSVASAGESLKTSASQYREVTDRVFAKFEN